METITLTEILDVFEKALKNATPEELDRFRRLQLSIAVPDTLYSPPKK